MRILLLFISFTFFSSLMAQDTIFLMNGKLIQDIKLIESNNVRLVPYMKNSKIKTVLWDDVFSVIKDGEKTVLYQTDTSGGNFLTEKGMWMYVQGMQHARRVYSTPLATMGGVAVGFGGALISYYYGLPIPAVYAVLKSTASPKIRKRELVDPYLLYDEHFVQGYKNHARSKKVRNSILGGLAGFASGVVFVLVYANNN